MFTARERQLLRELEGDAPEAWALRFWCAKEASAKATGCATGPVSSALTIEQADAERGTVLLAFDAPSAGRITLSASTARDGDWVVATCVDTSARAVTEARTV